MRHLKTFWKWFYIEIPAYYAIASTAGILVLLLAAVL